MYNIIQKKKQIPKKEDPETLSRKGVITGTHNKLTNGTHRLMCSRVVKNDQAGWEQKKGREKPSQTGTKEGIFQNKSRNWPELKVY